jgi:ferredoxin
MPIIHDNNKNGARHDRSAERGRPRSAKSRRAAAQRKWVEMSKTLKVHVDQEKCQGHARCKSLAPELFNLDEFGNAHEIGDGTVPAGLEDKAWLAQSNCPEIAIVVTEE